MKRLFVLVFIMAVIMSVCSCGDGRYSLTIPDLANVSKGEWTVEEALLNPTSLREEGEEPVEVPNSMTIELRLKANSSLSYNEDDASHLARFFTVLLLDNDGSELAELDLKERDGNSVLTRFFIGEAKGCTVKLTARKRFADAESICHEAKTFAITFGDYNDIITNSEKEKETKAEEQSTETAEDVIRNLPETEELPSLELPSDGTIDFDIACHRLLTEADVTNMSKQELRIMRNWIYARHGYIFKSDDMKDFFNGQEWYEGTKSDVTNLLSDIEKKNIQLIMQYE